MYSKRHAQAHWADGLLHHTHELHLENMQMPQVLQFIRKCIFKSFDCISVFIIIIGIPIFSFVYISMFVDVHTHTYSMHQPLRLALKMEYGDGDFIIPKNGRFIPLLFTNCINSSISYNREWETCSSTVELFVNDQQIPPSCASVFMPMADIKKTRLHWKLRSYLTLVWCAFACMCVCVCVSKCEWGFGENSIFNSHGKVWLALVKRNEKWQACTAHVFTCIVIICGGNAI